MSTRVSIAFFAAIMPLLVSVPVRAAETTPGGTYAIVDTSELTYPSQKKPPPHPQNGIVTQALMTPGVDGLLIHLRWSQISSSRETYVWDPLDAAIGLASHYSKRFEIGIVIGGATPAWVTAPAPTGMGAIHGKFQINASSAGTCPTFTMAAPYDPNFLAAFDDLLHQLSMHLRANRNYAHLGLIKLFGMTTTTDELRLPAVDHCAGGSDPVKIWMKLKYKPSKVEAAWNTMLQSYLKYFPDKAFSIGFIGVNAFPAINEKGKAIPAQLAKARSAQFVARLIADAGKAMPGHLAVGFDSLSLDVPTSVASYYSSRSEMFHDAQAAGARIGWQTNELLGEYPGDGAACKGTTVQDAMPCENSAQFRAMLFQGIYPYGKTNTPPALQGVYMEMFPQNITAWPIAVGDARRNLALWNGGR
jgi:hypothetical protein